MQEDKRKKAKRAAVAVPIIAAGTVAAISAYKLESGYTPSGESRKLQANQVVFSQDTNRIGQKDQQNNESQMLQKDNNSQDQDSQSQQKQSDYLFEDTWTMQHSTTLVSDTTSTSGMQNNISNTGSASGNVFDLTGDRTQADMVIGGNFIPGMDGNSNGNNIFDGTGNSNASQTPGGQNENNGTNSGTNGDSGNNSGGNSNTDNPTTPSRVLPDDPESKKANTVAGTGLVESKPFEDNLETMTPDDEDGDNPSVYIGKSMYVSGSMLYKGQSLTPRVIYNSLDTMVMDSNMVWRIWGSDAFEKYVRVDAVSFDGGTTWISQFPVTIPTDIEPDQMKIRVSWRLSQNNPNWKTREIDYEPELNRTFLLSKPIAEGSTQIDENTILNADNQHPAEGEKVNLYRYQWNLLGDDPLSALFPGWVEDGKQVPWFYYPEDGRHVLEPMDMVPLSNEYIVQLKVFWMQDDGTIDPDATNLAYLQTLTGYDLVGRDAGKLSWIQQLWNHRIVVPKYVQAIDIDSYEGLETDILEIPDTVMYIGANENSLRVNNRYVVDENNQWYASTEEGALMNKEETAILGIPYKAKELTVPANIDTVAVGAENQLQTVTIEADNIDEIPQISFSNLKNCNVVVSEDILEDFLNENRTSFTAKSGNTVSSAENPDASYFVENGCMIREDGTLQNVFTTGSNSIILPTQVKHIGTDAFNGISGVNVLSMPQNGAKVTLEKDCLAGSDIQQIRCFSQAQYDLVKEQLKQAGGSDAIEVELLKISKEGYFYNVSVQDGQQVVTLVNVSSDITSFDGTVTAEDGTQIEITEIEDQAFANCKELIWVDLPESVTKIGGQAFLDCTKLEGVLIENREQITIGNRAFDGCSAMRFLASNAMQAVMEDGYDPQVTDSYGTIPGINNYFYRPTYGQGYGTYALGFTEESGVAGYELVDIGDGCKMLYGVDSDGNPWLGLRSCSLVPEEVQLPSTTIELYCYSMAGTQSVNARYTLNWDELPTMWAFDEGCFRDAMVSGDIVFPENSYFDNEAFNGASCITSINLPGDSVFLGMAVFQYCTSLEDVTIGGLASSDTLYPSMFYGCNNLSDVTFTSEIPISLMIFSSTVYQFNYAWTAEEEAEKVRIHVPQGCEEAYVRAWRYALLGYGADLYYDTPYLEMWSDIQWKHIDWETWIFPDDAQVDAEVEETLLSSENRLRKMLRVDEVTYPTYYYPYRVNDGMVTLIGAPTDTDYLDMDYADFDLPEGWYFDYIGKDAFARCKDLQYIKVADNLTGIYSDAFGELNDSLILEFTSPTPVKLMTENEGETFSFGTDEDKIEIIVPEGWEEIYFNIWKYQMAGYEDYDAMHDAIYKELVDWDNIDWENFDFDTFEEPSEEEIDAEIQKRLAPVIPRLRRLLGLPQEETSGTEIPGTENPGTENLDTETPGIEPPDTGEITLPEDDAKSATDTESKLSGTDAAVGEDALSGQRSLEETQKVKESEADAKKEQQPDEATTPADAEDKKKETSEGAESLENVDPEPDNADHRGSIAVQSEETSEEIKNIAAQDADAAGKTEAAAYLIESGIAIQIVK